MRNQIKQNGNNTNKVRVTVSLDPGVYAKLPKKNRSLAVETIVREHYWAESSDRLYQLIKQKLLNDPELTGIEKVVIRCRHGGSSGPEFCSLCRFEAAQERELQEPAI